MCKNLRNITFTLGEPEYLYEATQAERKEMEELSKERTGFFHRWVEEVDTSKDIPYIKPMALVEDISDGSMHLVEYYNLKFYPEN